MKCIFGAIVREDDEDGGFWAEVPDLPGCFGSGDTVEDTVASVSDAVETHVAALVADGAEVPEWRDIAADDGRVVYVYADPETVDLGEPSVTASEAARRLGVTPARVSQLIKSGRLEARRLPTCTLVTVESLGAYAASSRRAGRPRKEVVTA